jgi:hypothetical protein
VAAIYSSYLNPNEQRCSQVLQERNMWQFTLGQS